MTTEALADTPTLVHPHVEVLDDRILKQVDEETVVSLDVLVTLMPQYSWSQIFQAVDRLARCGKVVLRRHRFNYTLFSNHYAA